MELVSPSKPKPLLGRAEVRGARTGSLRPVMKVEAQHVKVLSAGAVVISGTCSFNPVHRLDHRRLLAGPGTQDAEQVRALSREGKASLP